MSLSGTIAPHLPYLRRFARALTGSQSAGDAYASAALEAILEDPSVLSVSVEARAALFRVFIKIWLPVANDQSLEMEAEPEEPADRNLEAMSPAARVAFLLHAVEGFSIERLAAAMDITTDDANMLLEQAGREIALQISTDILIIEDEPLIAMDLEALVQELGHKVSAICRTHKEAMQAAKLHRPGLVLADIRLADGSSGLDAVNDILSIYDVPVIFITAYPEQLLTGERPEPAFLITKPFRPQTVQAVISQALFFERKAQKRLTSV